MYNVWHGNNHKQTKFENCNPVECFQLSSQRGNCWNFEKISLWKLKMEAGRRSQLMRCQLSRFCRIARTRWRQTTRTRRLKLVLESLLQFHRLRHWNPFRSSMKSIDSSSYTTPSIKFSALNRCSQRMREQTPCLMPTVSEIKQRIISARLLRMKQIQNQLEKLAVSFKFLIIKRLSSMLSCSRSRQLRIDCSNRSTNDKTPLYQSTKTPALNCRSSCTRTPKKFASGSSRLADAMTQPTATEQGASRKDQAEGHNHTHAVRSEQALAAAGEGKELGEAQEVRWAYARFEAATSEQRRHEYGWSSKSIAIWCRRSSC